MSGGWTTVDFQPAPAGWRALYLLDEDANGTGFVACPVAGWLIQERRSDHGEGTGRRVIAAVAPEEQGGEVEPVTACSNFWMLLGPGEEHPSADLVAEARQERREVRKILALHDAQRTAAVPR